MIDRWGVDRGWLGNVAVPFEVLDGPTFWINDTELVGALAQHGCRHPVQCAREFAAYGVTKFFTETEAGVPIEWVTLRRISVVSAAPL